MTLSTFHSSSDNLHFNSHPHKEDDIVDRVCNVAYCISTHILTRRMTSALCHRKPHLLFQLTSSQGGWRYADKVYEGDNFISTHILTRRMTYCLIFYRIPSIFQLTSSRGGWRWRKKQIYETRTISTHILTRRMTKQQSIQIIQPWIFQLTSSRGGWRNYYLCIMCNNRNFNSHPHEEDDSSEISGSPPAIISTHILTRRMTEVLPLLHVSLLHFNSHPHEEDDGLVSFK